MFVSEILPDLAEALGDCVNERAFRILTRAVRLLTRKRLFDQITGELSICVCGNFVTLPPEVRTVLAVQVDGIPVVIRNEWFTYHVNGPGDLGFTPFDFADVLGTTFCTIRDPDRAVKLVARLRNAADAGKKLRVYGWGENGERLESVGPDGKKQDGFYVPLQWGISTSPAGINPIVKIERVWKEDTADTVDLYAVDPANPIITLSKLGSYRAKENTPAYTRIRVPCKEVVRVKFKRKDDELRSEFDWINCDNSEAILLAVRAVKSRGNGLIDVGAAFESEATRLIKEDARSNQPGGIAPPQVIVTGASTCGESTDGLFY